MFVCCEFCVLSGRGLCDGLITRPEDSYRLWRVVVCDQGTLNEEAKARYGAVKNTTKRVVTPRKQTTYFHSHVCVHGVHMWKLRDIILLYPTALRRESRCGICKDKI